MPNYQEQPTAAIVSEPEGMLSARARAILGDNGVSRFVEFWTYQEGWHFGEGQPLSLASLGNLEYFLAQYNGFDSEPSLFLTRGGNLMLGWEDPRGEVVEVECTPDGYVLFLGADDTEQQFGLDETPRLLESLPITFASDAAR